MSAGEAVRQAAAAVLRGDAALAARINGVFLGPAVRASMPYVEVGEALAGDWGTKDRRGREVRLALLLRDATERSDRLAEIADRVERAIEALPRALDGWRVASVAFLRSRTAGEAPGRWLCVLEYRVRLLEG